MPTFYVGQKVNLKSSPDVPMTIEKTEDRFVYCNWLNKNDDPKSGKFSFDVLEEYISFEEKLDKVHE